MELRFKPMKNQISILHIAAEADPFISTGGLGQVVGSLANALCQLGQDARVLLPLYPSIRERYADKLFLLDETTVPLAWRKQKAKLYGFMAGYVPYYFLENDAYYGRENIYGYADDEERFAFLCKAVSVMLPRIGYTPDVCHVHDWHTALLPVYTKETNAPDWADTQHVLTIHNMEYQGSFPPGTREDILGLGREYEDLLTYNANVNFMKAGILAADAVTTVSPTYAQEIQLEGEGLEPVIRANAHKLQGILNGLDTTTNDPAWDSALHHTYDAASFPVGKRRNKQKLQHEAGLPAKKHVPLLAMVTRLVSHKGLDLVQSVFDEMLGQGMQFVVLGSGDAQYERFFLAKAEQYPEQVAAMIRFDGALAKRIYAGSDMFLMPSRREPCGLGQMTACRYGTLPIVRATGGLADSIDDCRDGQGNGFVFTDYEPAAMLQTVQDALQIYRADKPQWARLVNSAMTWDCSWGTSACKYTQLYRQTLAGAKGERYANQGTTAE